MTHFLPSGNGLCLDVHNDNNTAAPGSYKAHALEALLTPEEAREGVKVPGKKNVAPTHIRWGQREGE